VTLFALKEIAPAIISPLELLSYDPKLFLNIHELALKILSTDRRKSIKDILGGKEAKWLGCQSSNIGGEV
jgi:hypothetical protein